MCAHENQSGCTLLDCSVEPPVGLVYISEARMEHRDSPRGNDTRGPTRDELCQHSSRFCLVTARSGQVCKAERCACQPAREPCRKLELGACFIESAECLE